eukprot:TRINITY_DN78234_c0_g1_i1.p1 TRINITY_DN78234_c0_g1~~TRINITY_DN78234_c0_g1_i1.p1  ORF type:complete len:122 (-),score=24.70 TRINITY_DN78234_c0_g1_i1:161-526(-)
MSHYKELKELHQKYAAKGLEILAFPCSQFGGQELKDPDEIRSFALKMGATFRIMEKINVNPPDEHPVYNLLKQDGPRVRWNFHSKFLVSCGVERCTIRRYDGVMPKATTDDIDVALNGLPA